ncbi:MAG: RDD family protein [Dehalococcoidia bacterium]
MSAQTGRVLSNEEQAVVAPSSISPPSDYIDFWPRCGAYIIDYILSGVITFGAAVAIIVVASVVAFLFGDFAFQEDEDAAVGAAAILGIIAATSLTFAYFWFGNSWGGTPGKRLVGMLVVDSRHGGDLGLGRGFLRLFIWTLGALPLYLGWLWCIWDAKKQAWHDKAARSVVVANVAWGRPARRWYQRVVPLAAGGVMACLLVGLVGGAAIGLAVGRSANDRLDDLISGASDAYVLQAQRQAEIDSLYGRCSPDWIDETAVNSAQSLQSVIGLSDFQAALDDIRAEIEQFCGDSDVAGYCAGFAEVVTTWAAEEDVDRGSVEDGCLQRFEGELAGQIVAVGDCILYVGEGYQRTACPSPHDAEIVAVFEMPDDDGSEYPGEQAADDYAFQNCPLETTYYLYPTSSTWAAGDRQIACAVDEP